MTTPTVERADNRYQIRIDGELAAFAEFRDRDAQRVLFHTVVTEAFRGRGLSTVLIEQALARTREEGKRIVAVCPAVVRHLAKHDGFADIRDPADDDVLAWLSAHR